MKTQETIVYRCGYCGKFYYKREDADFCHSDRTCSTCGKVIGKKSYYVDCEECRNKKRIEKENELFEKAEKLTVDEYMKKYNGNYAYYDERYFYPDEYEELFEDCDMPKFVWGTKLLTVELNPYDIAEQYDESTELEDYCMSNSAIEDIKEFCKEWNKKHSETVYVENQSVAILLT